ncbi:RnhA Ribonuclease HI [Rhabdaerophilaceae bacterium]
MSAALPEQTTTTIQGKPSAGAIVAYADGSSLGNPGHGGWAFVIVHADGTRRTRAGAIRDTTNNRAELRAAIEALLELPGNAVGILNLDSEIIVKSVNEWRPRWERNGWRASKGGPVANADLLKTLFGLVDDRPGIRLKWVRGHAGDPLNELCDTLAKTEAERGAFEWQQDGSGR